MEPNANSLPTLADLPEEDVMPVYGADGTPQEMIVEQEPLPEVSDPVAYQTAAFLSTTGLVGPKTDEEFRASYYQDIVREDFDAAMQNYAEADKETRRQAIMSMASDPKLDIGARVAVVEALASLDIIPRNDVNALTREGLINTVVQEETIDPFFTPDDRFAALADVEALPTTPIGPQGTEDYPEGVGDYWEFMNSLSTLMQNAEQGQRLFNFFPTLVPGRLTEMYNKIGREILPDNHPLMENFLAATISTLAGQGELAEAIGQHVINLPGQERMAALKKIEDILNRELPGIDDANPYITAQVLSSIFRQALTGETRGGDPEGTDWQINEMLRIDEALASYERMPAVGGNRGGGRATIDRLRRRREELASGTAEQESSTASTVASTVTLNNMFGVLDIYGTGQLARGTVILGNKYLPTLLSRANQVAPVTAGNVAANALADSTGEVARRLGVSREQLAENLLPTHRELLNGNTTETVVDEVTRQVMLRDEFARIAQRSSLTTTERAAATQEVAELLNAASNFAPHLHLGKTSIIAGDNGVAVSGVFGRTPTQGFGSYKEALDAARTVIGEGIKTTVYRTTRSGKLVPAREGASGEGRFFFSFDQELPFELASRTFANLTTDMGEISLNGLSGTALRALKPLGSVFNKEMLDPARLELNAQRLWQALAGKTLQAVTALNRKQYNLLSRAITETENLGKTTGKHSLTTQELAYLGLDDATTRAYVAVRSANDMMWEFADDAVYRARLTKGMSDVWGPTGRIGAGTVLKTAAAAADNVGGTGVAVYDAANKTFVTLTRAQVTALYNNGGSIAKMATPVVTKENDSIFVMLTGKATAKPLARGRQVARIPGYFPHMFQGNFIMFGVTKTGNRVALGIGKTEADVAGRVAKLEAARQAGKKGADRFTKYDYEFDASLTELGRSAAVTDDVYINMGGAVFGQRNAGYIRNMSKWAGAAQLDPIAATIRGMDIVGSTVTKHRVLDHMMTKLVNTVDGLGIRAGDSVKGTEIRNVLEIASSSPTKQAAVKKARAMYEQIETMRLVPDAVETFVGNRLRSLGNYIDNIRVPKNNKLAQEIKNNLASSTYRNAAAGIDPLQAAKTLVAKFTIAASAPLHLAYGVMQSTVALGMRPQVALRSVRNMGGVSAALSAKVLSLSENAVLRISPQTLDRIYKAVSVGTTYTADELKDLVDGMYSSGLVSSVAHSSYVRTSLVDASLTEMTAKASRLARSSAGLSSAAAIGKSAANKPYEVLSAVGFEAGELFNRIATFVSIHEANRVAGVAKSLKNNSYLQELAGKVSAVTGDMLPEFSMAYERGWLKNATQFWGHGHKMLALAMPRMFGGSQSLTRAEKIGLVATQMLLFGRHSTPAAGLIAGFLAYKVAGWDAENPEAGWKDLWENEFVQNTLNGWGIDTTINFALQTMLGEDEDFNISKKLAPMNGVELMFDAIMAAYRSNGSALLNPEESPLFGPSTTTASRCLDLYRSILKFTFALGSDYRSDDLLSESANDVSERLATLAFSPYSRYVAANIAMDLDGYVSRGGKIDPDDVDTLEAAMFVAFGINTKDRDAFLDAQRRYYSTAMTPEQRDEQLSSVTNDLWQDLVRASLQTREETGGDPLAWGRLMDKWLSDRHLLLSFAPPEDREAIEKKLLQRLEQAKEGNDAERALYENILKSVGDLNNEATMDLMARLRLDPNLQNHPDLLIKIRDEIENAMAEVEEAEEGN